MEEQDAQLLAENPEWRQILHSYAASADACPPRQDATGPRWFERSAEAEPADCETTRSAHGMLIAYGWLAFQLEDGKAGLTYRITSTGRRALSAVEQLVAEEASLARSAANADQTDSGERHLEDDVSAVEGGVNALEVDAHATIDDRDAQAA